MQPPPMASDCNPSSESRLAFFLFLVASLLLTGSFFYLGQLNGKDFANHIFMWLGAVQVHGLPPWWAASANFGYGDARFIFYPPLSWLFGALLVKLFPLTAVPAIFLLTSAVLAATAMGRFASRFLPLRESILAAVIFAISPHCFRNIWQRAAYAEVLATFGFVLCIHFLISVCDSPSPRRVAWLGLSLGVVWLTEVPLGVITAITMTVLAALHAWSTRQLPFRLFAAALLAIGLTAIYSFGVLSEFHEIDASGLKQDFHTSFPFKLGVTNILLLVIQGLPAAWLLFHLCCTGSPLFRLTSTLTALAALMMSPISNFLWRLPVIEYVQFPFRWQMLLAIPYSLGAAMFLSARPRLLAACSIAGILLAVLAPIFIPSATADTARILTAAAGTVHHTPEYGGGFNEIPIDDAGDWTPRTFTLQTGMDPTPLAQAPSCPTPKITAWYPEYRAIDVTCPTSATLKLRLAYFPLWHATGNGLPLVTSPDQQGVLQVQLPSGQTRVELALRPSIAQRIGAALSISSLIVIGILVFPKKRYAGWR